MSLSIIIAWSALICGPDSKTECLVWASQCLYYEYTMNGGDADGAFELCAEQLPIQWP